MAGVLAAERAARARDERVDLLGVEGVLEGLHRDGVANGREGGEGGPRAVERGDGGADATRRAVLANQGGMRAFDGLQAHAQEVVLGV